MAGESEELVSVMGEAERVSVHSAALSVGGSLAGGSAMAGLSAAAECLQRVRFVGEAVSGAEAVVC